MRVYDILVSQYEAARAALADCPIKLDNCTQSMRRLRLFLEDREVPEDLAHMIPDEHPPVPHYD